MKKIKGKTKKLKVKDSTVKGKNIYKNIKGFENNINYILTDLPKKKSGLKKLMICVCTIYPGKVNKEFRMTRGHRHKVEEIYIFLEGRGHLLIGKKKTSVKKGDIVTIPANKWHRAVNTGRSKLVFLNVFEKGTHKHLRKY